MTMTVCTFCGNEAAEGDCEYCGTHPSTMEIERPAEDSADDVAVSKALADPRFNANFDRSFGKGWA